MPGQGPGGVYDHWAEWTSGGRPQGVGITCNCPSGSSGATCRQDCATNFAHAVDEVKLLFPEDP